VTSFVAGVIRAAVVRDGFSMSCRARRISILAGGLSAVEKGGAICGVAWPWCYAANTAYETRYAKDVGVSHDGPPDHRGRSRRRSRRADSRWRGAVRSVVERQFGDPASSTSGRSAARKGPRHVRRGATHDLVAPPTRRSTWSSPARLTGERPRAATRGGSGLPGVRPAVAARSGSHRGRKGGAAGIGQRG
jgi:hypothetical protein